MSRTKRIMIVAGEASGDLHGANLVKELRRLDPDVSFVGIGGARMREAGVETVEDAARMAVVGLVEVLAHFDVIFGAFMALKRILASDPPDLLILIDYPDFNLRLAKVAKARGVKVLYYISPQVWAWRMGRVKKIARLVDHMAVVFPFEVPFYVKEGVPVTFVGHPLVDQVRPSMPRDEAIKIFGLDPKRRTIGLFPGSRRSEIRHLFQTILDSAKLLKERYPDAQFVLPLASSLMKSDIMPLIEAAGVDVRVIEGQSHDVANVCDAIITVSGTVTLEIALIGTPMVIIYRVSPLTYEVGRRLIRVEHAGICNIVAGERVAQELIQYDAEPGRIAAEIGRILDDAAYAQWMRAKFAQAREKLGKPGGSAHVARLALEMMGKVS